MALDQPDPFVESLQHDSIIVQIPLLRGKVNNRLEKVLSVFDQSQIHTDDPKFLKVDENSYADDDDMVYIVHRLQSAASDPDIRNSMNAEDEFFKAIEDRDTEIMLKDKLLKQKDQDLKQKDTAIRAAILALHKSGMPAAVIAKTMNMTESEIEDILI